VDFGIFGINNILTGVRPLSFLFVSTRDAARKFFLPVLAKEFAAKSENFS
jgi:hypothetical protein